MTDGSSKSLLRPSDRFFAGAHGMAGSAIAAR